MSTVSDCQHSYVPNGPHPPLPSNLRLKQVLVICRHGDRSPIAHSLGTLIKDTQEAADYWTAQLPSQDDMDQWNQRFPPRPLDSSEPVDDSANADRPWGWLSKRGAAELQALGRSLGAFVQDAGGAEGPDKSKGLWPAGKVDPRSIFVRATHLRRTHQSAQNLLLGMGLDLEDGEPVYINVRPVAKETLYPNPAHSPPRVLELMAEVKDQNKWPGQDELFQRAAKAFGLEPGAVKWTEAREILTCHAVYRLPMPKGVLEPDETAGRSPAGGEAPRAIVEDVVDYVGWLWGRWYDHQELTRLSLGRLFWEILEVMGLEGPADNGHGRAKFVLFSGHDSTLVPVLGGLQIYGDRWPGYGSYVTLETAEDVTAAGGGEVVRVVYNGQEMELPGASGVWMSREEFRQRLQPLLLSPSEEAKLRNAPKKESASMRKDIAQEIGSTISGKNKKPT